MKKIKFLLLMLTIFLSTACFNYRELNSIVIATACGVDIKDDKYLLTVQIANTIKESADSNTSSNQAKFMVYESEGKTIQEAFRKILLKLPRKIYGQHMNLFVIGEELAKKGIVDVLDFGFRDSEFNKQSLVAIVKNDTANNLLKTITPIQTLNSENIVEMIETNNKYSGTVIPVKYEDLIKSYLSDKEDIYLPALSINNNKNSDDSENLKSTDIKSEIKLDGTSLFKNDKLVGFLNNTESIYLTFFKNNINVTVITPKCDSSNYMSLEILKSKTKIGIKNNNMTISVSGDAVITEVPCQFDINKYDDIKKIENIVNLEIKNGINDVINKTTNTYKTDVIGYRNLYYKYNNKFYQKNKDNLNINYIVKVDIKVKEKGDILKVTK